MSINTTIANAPVSSVTTAALASIVMLGLALPAIAALPAHPCIGELNRLIGEWNAAGFQPSKPGQQLVRGRNGQVSSGPEVTRMVSEIRQAIQDCQHGDVQAVQQRVARLTEQLQMKS
jgi:hypothetical protein